jgi:hypothetical protein
MPLLQSAVSVAQLHHSLRWALAKLDQMGVPWRGRRFEGFLAKLEKYVVQPPIDPHEWVLFSRAVSQTMQLVMSAPLWDRMRRVKGRYDRLERVCRDEAPPERDPSNLLSELAIAGALYHSGRRVDLGVSDELDSDCYSQFGPWMWVVECKRPQSEAAIVERLFEAVEQLEVRRMKVSPEHRGMAVIVGDLLLEQLAPPPITATVESLQEVVRHHTKEIYDLVGRKHAESASQGYSVLPHANMIATFTVFPVRIEGGGMYVPMACTLIPPTAKSPEAQVLALSIDTDPVVINPDQTRHLLKRPK